jgi:16S rRNA G966 N2-methylase RsmD
MNLHGRAYLAPSCRDKERKQARENRRARYSTVEGRAQIRESNRDYMSRPGVKETFSEKAKEKYRSDENHRLNVIQKSAKWADRNHDRKRKRAAEYFQENKEVIRRKLREKSKSNVCIKLRNLIRSRVNEAINSTGKSKGGKSVLRFLPYSMEELKAYLESNFEDWMNWDNYGDLSKGVRTWNIDHIMPQSMFEYESMEHANFNRCWSLKNLRPYDSKENFADGNRRKLLGEFRSFDEISDQVRKYISKPESKETPSEIVSGSLKYQIEDDSCPMAFFGISYLDSIFHKRFHTNNKKFVSLVELVKDDEAIFDTVIHLLKQRSNISIQSIVYNLKFTVRTPGHFFPMAAFSIIKEYATRKKVFDPFLGWGGRALGAICADAAEYTGCDLQPEVVEACNKMKDDFSGCSRTRVNAHNVDCFEFLKQTDEKFDLIFTSPPYLDTEDYGVDSNSMGSDWLDSFVFPLTEEFKRHISPSGHVILHLKDINGAPVYTAYHSAMKAAGFTHVKKYRYGRTWTQGIHVYRMT